VIYDKEEDWIDYYVSAICMDENNQIVSLFTIFTDISERKKHERDLEQYNVQITNILESITDGFFAVNHKYTVTYMNAEAERLLGMSRNFLINENLWDTFGHGAPLSYYSEYTVLSKKMFRYHLMIIMRQAEDGFISMLIHPKMVFLSF
jgi:PAS domain-containing protein